MSIAIAYAEEAIADRRRTWACVWLRHAARRFLNDLRRSQGSRPKFTFSPRWANRACAFIETLPHVEEKWDTDTITLEPAQIFLVVQLFGFRIPAGRRFTELLYAVARKNAKSTLAAAIMITCMCLEKVPGAQLMSAATTGSQARIVWSIAKKMIDARPDLKETFEIETFANTIVRYDTSSVFKPINSKASTQDGLNPSHVELDEIHAHKTADLLNVLRSAAGARGNPLWMYTTTEGYLNAGPWEDLRTFARQVLSGVLRADHFLALIYAIDDEDDVFDEDKWIKANPLLTCNRRLFAEIQKLALNAKAMPSALAEFTIKRCNRAASTATGYVNLHRYNQNTGKVVLEELVGFPCWAALDLSSTTDMCSWCLLFLKDGRFYAFVRYWVPEDQVKQRTERRSVPYASWVTSGFIVQTEGERIDQSVIKAQVLDDAARYSPRKIGYDPWNAAAMANDLAAEGLPVEQFIQGPRSYHPAMKAFDVAYGTGRFVHGGNPVLRWNFSNLVARADVNDNLAPNKQRSADKIDGACCVIMAFGLAEADDTGDFDAFLNAPVVA